MDLGISNARFLFHHTLTVFLTWGFAAAEQTHGPISPVSSVPESIQSEVSTLQINVASTGTHSLEKKRIRIQKGRPDLCFQSVKTPSPNFGENPWLRKWAYSGRGGVPRGRALSGQITYPNMKEGGRRTEEERGKEGRKGEREGAKEGKSEVAMDLNLIDFQSKFISVLSHNPSCLWVFSSKSFI